MISSMFKHFSLEDGDFIDRFLVYATLPVHTSLHLAKYVSRKENEKKSKLLSSSDFITYNIFNLPAAHSYRRIFILKRSFRSATRPFSHWHKLNFVQVARRGLKMCASSNIDCNVLVSLDD
jgi:hypothetical protein